ncbi:MAG: sulfatase [Spirochaetaceae bacterium]
MNIVYIHTHDTGKYIEPYGYAIPTPNLMKFTGEGTLFRNAFCTGPTCSPSRAGLLTGMAPHSCGMTGLSHRGFAINDYDKHLVRFLNRQGYETSLCGVQHEAADEKTIGYQNILHDEQYTLENFKAWDLANAHKASDYIKEKKDKPFFLSFGMVNTHRPYPVIDDDINPDNIMPPFPVPDTVENREDMAAYITSVKVVDQCVGMVIKSLEDSGIRNETLIIFTTDHGIAFPRMKCNLYDTGMGVSLIMDYPGNRQKGIASDALVSHLDIFPTICGILDFKKPDWLQGISMVSLFKGQNKEIRETLFSEVTFHAAYEPMRCIRSKRYKYIRIFSGYDRYIHFGGDGGRSDQFFKEHGGGDLHRNEEMLFDLYLDPVERNNLIEVPSYKSVYNKMKQDLETWMAGTNDPLLDGDILSPQGAIIGKPEKLNPRIKI